MKRATLHLCLAAFLAVLTCGFTTELRADTFGPGDMFTATFHANPNTANELFIFTNTPVTFTGAPVITVNLYDGSTLLSSVTSSLTYFGAYYFQFGFLSPTSPFAGVTPHGTADFTSINDGSINGLITVSMTGGTITGLDLSTIVLYDAYSAASNEYVPLGDLTNKSIASTPEPSSLLLSGTGVLSVALLGFFQMRKAQAEL
jgi:hypothetical protein